MNDPTGNSGHMNDRTAVSANEVTRLMAELGDPDITPRRHARESLVKMGEASLPALHEGLAKGNFLVRWEVAKAVIEMKSPQSIPALIGALEDEEQDVRWLAAVALAEIGRESLAPLFEAVLNNLSSLFLRQGLHHVLTIYRDPELRTPLLHLREALGPLENDVGIVQVLEDALKILRK